MAHPRYGDLNHIWRKTHGNCHLCRRPVDLDTYGFSSIFGAEAATVDHLIPQSMGGDDEIDNLLPAHLGCNASRGTGDIAHTRLRLAGNTAQPMSTDDRVIAGAALTLGTAWIAGHANAQRGEDGVARFNGKSAIGWGLAALTFSLISLS